MGEEQNGTGPKKTRGRARGSLALIEAMVEVARRAQPITGRGIGYKLFTLGLINSMSRQDMKRVYRLLKEAREEGIIPWHWIVDEAREFERRPCWNDPAEFAEAASRQYRRDFWTSQPVRVEVWSEKRDGERSIGSGAQQVRRRLSGDARLFVGDRCA